MRTVTAEDVKKAVLASGVTRIDHHACAMCDHVVFYSIEKEEVVFNASCHCATEAPRKVGWEDPANWINMQSNEYSKVKIMEKFFLNTKEFVTEEDTVVPLVQQDLEEPLRQINRDTFIKYIMARRNIRLIQASVTLTDELTAAHIALMDGKYIELLTYEGAVVSKMRLVRDAYLEEEL